MRIERLNVFIFPVPFKVVFRHASASRGQAENLIVAAHSDCGLVGYGEGCPRHYVTGETVEGGLGFIRKFADAITDSVQDEESLRAWIDSHRSIIDQNPAAFCAVEIAILDLIGKVKRRPVEDLVDVPLLAGAYTYSAILGDAPYLAFRWQFRRYWKQGLRDFKVKVSGDLQRDRGKIGVFRKKTDPALRVRLDANNLWISADDCVRHITGLSYDLFAIEEPLQVGDLDGFRHVGEECQAKIILDESLLRVEQIDTLDDAKRWIVNLRVSKMGGIIRSLEVAEKARQGGIGIIVGAQVGETSILTRAGLTIMNAIRPNLVASEGAFGTHLLQRDLTSQCLMFGVGGALDVEQVVNSGDPGLGLQIDNKELTLAEHPL
jgi:L-alanine-DL-glutamate epimerase-like enolase superfamily enzyme